MSTCAVIPAATATNTAPSYLARPTPSSFITRSGHQLFDPDTEKEFKIAGPNIYWLGLDENVEPNPSYPSKGRVLEAMSIAATMGASVVRSTTLGVSVGTTLAIEPTLGVFNQQALDTVAFAVYAARIYGLRLIIPLTDQYDYYHGGYSTFLKWRSMASDNQSAFYDTTSVVYSDFVTYVDTLLNYTSSYTSLALKDDPTILSWETGNELSHPPESWTTAITTHLKSLSPNVLTTSGSYGIVRSDLSTPSVDIVTNHFYPPSAGKYSSDASRAQKSGKVYFAGEYDWAGKSRVWQNFLWCILPLALLLVTAFLPGRWFPLRLPLWRKKATKGGQGEYQPTPSTPLEDLPSPKRSPSPSQIESFSKLPNEIQTRRHSQRKTLGIKKWHLLVWWGLWVGLTAVIIYFGAPSGLQAFLSEAETKGSGSLYWSLFGRDDSCCRFVEHDDGFTLHYPGTTSSMRESVVELTEHAYRLTGLPAGFLPSSIAQLKTEMMPAVACPQPNLVLRNGSTIQRG